jgi:hypothetical protein
MDFSFAVSSWEAVLRIGRQMIASTKIKRFIAI